MYSLYYPSSDESILLEISSSFIQLKELSIAQINVREHSYDKFPYRNNFVSCKLRAGLTAGSLAELWNICPKPSEATITATTQNGMLSTIMPFSRLYCSDQMYNLKIFYSRFATNTLFANIKSLHANTCFQVYSQKVGFAAYYPKLNAKGDSLRETLYYFKHDFGSPEHLTFNGFQSQVGKNTNFFKNHRKYNIDHHVSSPRCTNENPVEGANRLNQALLLSNDATNEGT